MPLINVTSMHQHMEHASAERVERQVCACGQGARANKT